MGTVQGDPTFNDMVALCKKEKCKKAWLIPFMTVTGDHMVNDIAGEDNDSLRSMLESKGITCEAVYSGTLDNPGISEVWLDHLKEAVMSLGF